jgi:hypothetical protein
MGLAVVVAFVVGDGLDMLGSRVQPMLKVRLRNRIIVRADISILFIILF